MDQCIHIIDRTRKTTKIKNIDIDHEGFQQVRNKRSTRRNIFKEGNMENAREREEVGNEPNGVAATAATLHTRETSKTSEDKRNSLEGGGEGARPTKGDQGTTLKQKSVNNKEAAASKEASLASNKNLNEETPAGGKPVTGISAEKEKGSEPYRNQPNKDIEMGEVGPAATGDEYRNTLEEAQNEGSI